MQQVDVHLCTKHCRWKQVTPQFSVNSIQSLLIFILHWCHRRETCITLISCCKMHQNPPGLLFHNCVCCQCLLLKIHMWLQFSCRMGMEENPWCEDRWDVDFSHVIQTTLFASKNMWSVGKHRSMFSLTQLVQSHSFYLVLCVEQSGSDSLQTSAHFIHNRKDELLQKVLTMQIRPANCIKTGAEEVWVFTCRVKGSDNGIKVLLCCSPLHTTNTWKDAHNIYKLK